MDSAATPDISLEPASVLLYRLQDEAPKDRFTISWLLGSLRDRSFGIVLLILGLFAMLPGASFPAGLIMMIPAWQMFIGREAPRFPRWLAERPLNTSHLTALARRTIPMLRFLERFIHPRWPVVFFRAKRPLGIAVLLLDLAVTFIPIPFSNVPPAALIAFLALAYLEEDGICLLIGFAATLLGIAIGVVLGWQTLVQMNLV